MENPRPPDGSNFSFHPFPLGKNVTLFSSAFQQIISVPKEKKNTLFLSSSTILE